jgi:hypothetical protein
MNGLGVGKFSERTLAGFSHLTVNAGIKLETQGESAVARKSVLILSFIVMLTVAAAAQIPTKGNIFFGYSYNRADFNGARANFNGWDGSLEGNVAPWVGIVADVSGHYGSNDSIHSVVFGPRVSVSVGKITPFAHALFGFSRFSSSAASDISFADAIGGGVDYRLFHVLGWRFQLDALQTRFFSRTQDDFRFSTGVVLHF